MVSGRLTKLQVQLSCSTGPLQCPNRKDIGLDDAESKLIVSKSSLKRIFNKCEQTIEKSQSTFQCI